MIKINYEREKEFIMNVLKKESIEFEDAEIIADVLVSADLRGIKSHGLARLPVYLERLRKGVIEKESKIEKIKEEKGTLLLNGSNCMGQIASKVAMNKAISLAKEYGISMVGINNCNHFGIAAYYSMMAAEKKLIGFVSTNTSPLMAPFGGKKAMLGTNPFTVAIPAGNEKDIVLDMATSLVPRGKIEVFNREGKTVPIGWGIDKNGLNTTNPSEILEGTVLPMGGPKGYGMAIVIDIISGLLTNATYLNEVGSLFGDQTRPQNLGTIMICIDPKVFMDIDDFRLKIDNYIKEIKNSPKADGNDTIFLPGEIEFNNEEKNKKEGIELGEDLYNEIKKLNEIYKINIDDYLVCG